MRATAAALRVGRYRHEDQQRDESTDAEQLMGFHIIEWRQLLCQYTPSKWRMKLLDEHRAAIGLSSETVPSLRRRTPNLASTRVG
jgi:hypothetical protein